MFKLRILENFKKVLMKELKDAPNEEIETIILTRIVQVEEVRKIWAELLGTVITK